MNNAWMREAVFLRSSSVSESIFRYVEAGNLVHPVLFKIPFRGGILHFPSTIRENENQDQMEKSQSARDLAMKVDKKLVDPEYRTIFDT